jgi:deferrochelatase/peroxidase EfeB
MTAGPAGSPVPDDLQDVQRLVLKGYHATAALHVGLSVRSASHARAFLGLLADPSGDSGTLTTAREWHETTGVCLTVGLTAAGLRALGVPEAQLSTFPAEFRQGAAARASVMGDVGPSRPAAWLPWLRGATGGELHLLLSLLASEQEIEAALRQLTEQWEGGLRELGRLRAAALPLPDGDAPTAPTTGPDRPDDEPVTRDMLVHFGYRDGFSQPTLEDLPQIGLADPLPKVPVGALVLGHDLALTDRRGLAYRYPVPGSDRLGRNGSFAAFRVMEQDVRAFEEFLSRESVRTGESPELLAAKLCGRWRDGTPLALRPTDADGEVKTKQRNDFDYAGGGATEAAADPDGVRCPLGSHIRRMNPRGTPVAGSPMVASHRRIVRRGMPYGPPYDPEQPGDGESRGLVGLFIGASLRDSYEFVLREWANDGAFSASLGRSQDPLLGTHEGAGRDVFDAPGTSMKRLEGLTRFVTTRGCAYLFLPSATALRELASTPPDNPAVAVPYATRHQDPGARPPARTAGRAPPAGGRQPVGAAAARLHAAASCTAARASRGRPGAADAHSRGRDPLRRRARGAGATGRLQRLPLRRRHDRGQRRCPVRPGHGRGTGVRNDRELLKGVVPPRTPAGCARRCAGSAGAARRPGAVDVVRYARALAVRVAADRLGVRGLAPHALVEQCHEVFVGIFSPVPDPARTQRARAARELLRRHVSELVELAAARPTPEDDALGRLVAAAAAGQLTRLGSSTRSSGCSSGSSTTSSLVPAPPSTSSSAARRSARWRSRPRMPTGTRSSAWCRSCCASRRRRPCSCAARGPSTSRQHAAAGGPGAPGPRDDGGGHGGPAPLPGSVHGGPGAATGALPAVRGGIPPLPRAPRRWRGRRRGGPRPAAGRRAPGSRARPGSGEARRGAGALRRPPRRRMSLGVSGRRRARP